MPTRSTALPGAVVASAVPYLARPLTMAPPDGRQGAWSFVTADQDTFMEAFLISTGIVALAEVGDKTQLLALILAARFRKAHPIILGIFAATVANHGFAGALGSWITALTTPQTMRWVLGISFLVMAVW